MISYRFMKSDYTIPVEIKGLKVYHHKAGMELESGEKLEDLRIAYHTYGQINETKDNVVWICHALTANSDALDWWPGLVGPGCAIDPEKHFIICSNILGSCYGSTGPRSINPATGEPYGMGFPFFTIRDMVQAQNILRLHLSIEKINLCIGGSCGGHQVLEFGIMFPEVVERMAMLVTSAQEMPWSIAIHEAQRMALDADPTFRENSNKAGAKGLQAARGMALLNYRTINSYNASQLDTDGRTDDFKAASYIQYQGLKLERRFYAHCYWHLLNSLDSHNISRWRGAMNDVLQQVKIPALVIAIDSDRLIPAEEQLFLAKYLPMSTYHLIQSDYGHDGFLIEAEQISKLVQEWWEG